MRGAKESVRDMTRYEDTLEAEIHPIRGEVREGNPPVFFPFIDVRLETEPVNPIVLAQETFMVLAVMLVSDAGVETEEGR